MLRTAKDDVSPVKIFLVEVFILLALITFSLYKGGIILNLRPIIQGQTTFEGMSVEVKQREGNMIKVTFDNHSDTEMNIGGWGGNQRACLTTTEGEYWFDFNSHMGYTIPAHSIREALLVFKNAEGTVKNLKIDEIQTLVDGLPTFGTSGIVEIPLVYEKEVK